MNKNFDHHGWFCHSVEHDRHEEKDLSGSRHYWLSRATGQSGRLWRFGSFHWRFSAMDDIVKLQGKKIEDINPDSQFLKSKQNIAIWRKKLDFFISWKWIISLDMRVLSLLQLWSCLSCEFKWVYKWWAFSFKTETIGLRPNQRKTEEDENHFVFHQLHV